MKKANWDLLLNDLEDCVPLSQQELLQELEHEREFQLNRLAVQELKRAVYRRHAREDLKRLYALHVPNSAEAPIRRRYASVLWAACVSLLLVFGSLYWLVSQDLYSDMNSGVAQSILRRSNGNQLWEEAFFRSDFKQVIELLGSHKSLGEKERILLSISYLESRQSDKSLLLLHAPMSQQWEEYRQWFYAMTLLRERQFDEAYVSLKQIRNNSDHTYFEWVSDWDLLRLRLRAMLY